MKPNFDFEQKLAAHFVSEGLVVTHRVREYIYRLAWIIAFVWLALGVVDIATGLGRGRGINLIEVLVLLVVAIAIVGLGLAVRNIKH